MRAHVSKRLIFASFALTIALAGCASSGGGGGSSRSSPSRLTMEDFTPDMQSLNLLTVIQRLRPAWLRARGNSVASDMSRRSSTGSRGGTSVSKVTKKVIGLLPVPTDPRQMSMSTGPYGPPRVPRQEAVPPRAAYAPQGDMQQVYQSSHGAQESVRPQSMLPHMNSPFVMKQNGSGQPAAASSRPQGSSKTTNHSRRGRQKATSSHKVH